VDRREGKRKGREGRGPEGDEDGEVEERDSKPVPCRHFFFPLQALNGTSANTRFTATVIDRHGCNVDRVTENVKHPSKQTGSTTTTE